MVIGTDYFDAAARFTHRDEFKTNGIGHLTLDRQLVRARFAVARRYPEPDRQWPPAPFAPVHICRVRTPEMKGPVTKHHYVVMLDTGEVYDPDKPPRIEGAEKRTLADYPRVLDVAGLFPLSSFVR
jgi:hypothetical protein